MLRYYDTKFVLFNKIWAWVLIEEILVRENNKTEFRPEVALEWDFQELKNIVIDHMTQI